MAHFNRTRSSWALNDVPTAGEWNDIDDKTSKAVNGDEGGAWAPTSPLVVGGSGVQFALSSGGGFCGDIAALKAIASPGARQMALVLGMGVYVFDAGNPAAEELPWRVAPTVGNGRWVHEALLLRDVAGGFAMLGADQRIAGSRSNIINLKSVLSAATVTVAPGNGTVYEDALYFGLPVNAKAGDIVRIDVSGKITFSGSGGIGQANGFPKARLALREAGGATYTFPETWTGLSAIGANDSCVLWSAHAFHEVVSATTAIDVMAQVACYGGSSNGSAIIHENSLAPMRLSALHVRP